MKHVATVHLLDEHNQPIRLYLMPTSQGARYFWAFDAGQQCEPELPEGPFAKLTDAINDAEAYALTT